MAGESGVTIDREERDGLYELVRNHLGSIEDFWVALERTKNFAAVERMGIGADNASSPAGQVGAGLACSNPPTRAHGSRHRCRSGNRADEGRRWYLGCRHFLCPRAVDDEVFV